MPTKKVNRASFDKFRDLALHSRTGKAEAEESSTKGRKEKIEGGESKKEALEDTKRKKETTKRKNMTICCMVNLQDVNLSYLCLFFTD